MEVGLVADVGRLSVRFGIVDRGGAAPREVERYSTADHPTFTDALLGYVRRMGLQNQPLPSALAIAGAVHGNLVNLTGSRWFVSLAGVEAVLRAPPRALNECAACAMALTRIGAGDLLPLRGPVLAPPRAGGNFLVLSPATGLGVAALIGRDGELLPVQSEAAHMAFAATTDDEAIVARHLIRRGQPVSNEALLSGGGLLAIHAALGGRAERPEDVTRAAGRDPLASRAVDVFIGALGAVIGDLVLAFGAWDGVFLTGSMSRALRSQLAGAGFRERIEGKAAFRRQLGQLPLAVVNRGDLELLGAAAALASR